MNIVLLRLLQVALFAPAPFFAWPWKPLLNAVFGDSYGPGIKHFRDGHWGHTNLMLHVVALFVQVGSNVALLNQIDARVLANATHPTLTAAEGAWTAFTASWVPAAVAALGPATPVPVLGGTVASVAAIAFSFRPFTLLTVTVWTAYLFVAARAPLLRAKIPSAVVLFGAYAAAPFVTLKGLDMFTSVAFGATLLLVNFLWARRKLPAKQLVRGLILPAVLYFAMPVFSEKYTGLYKQHHDAVLVGVLAYLVAVAALLRNPIKPIVLTGVALCRAAGVLTDELALCFLGYGFLGSLLQGVAHMATNEEATLLALEREGDDAKVRFEYSHVTFFPCLLLHSLDKII